VHARTDDEEASMAVAMMVDNPNGSQEIYERVRALLGMEKPAGGIFHVAGPSPNGGWRVIARDRVCPTGVGGGLAHNAAF
jgi:hypothetical protein